ncbi:MAG: DUF554 domain-containing protein [Clostridiales bacterium]|jgi:uncharacterized membrane protein YqgA involved in biofilm formation|nr:DUF554 domain-containing protein [Clostridiales bacterium]
MIGTLANVVAVIIGGGLGLLFRRRLPARLTDSLIKAMGLCVFVIGISGAIKGDIMLLVVSLGLGTLIGEILDIDKALNRLGAWLQKKLGSGESKLAEGFVTTTLLFCVGAMAIVGSIESGLTGDHTIIFTKSVIDAVSSIVFASALGAGVLLSAIPVLLYQGSIVLFAGALQGVFSEALISQISATGCVMILAIGLNMITGAKIKVANLLPALLVAVAYYYLILV